MKYKPEKETFEDKFARGASIVLVIMGIAYVVAVVVLVISISLRILGVV